MYIFQNDYFLRLYDERCAQDESDANFAGRSRNVLLVKNVRDGTTAEELAKHMEEAALSMRNSSGYRANGPWKLLRLILAPQALTAIAEFQRYAQGILRSRQHQGVYWQHLGGYEVGLYNTHLINT